MNEDTSQVTLSYELLHLIRWIVENEPEQLKTIIDNALQNGLNKDFKQKQMSEESASEAMHYSIVDFLTLMEIMLNDSVNEQTMKNVVEKKLMPALDHIDTTECDTAIVKGSAKRASSQIEAHPNSSAQELLFQELLRSWNPNKKTSN
jgi:hypothetical protein